jgi:hypothetical protein
MLNNVTTPFHQKQTFCKIIRIKNDYEVLHYRVFQQVCLPGSSERILHQL